ncbi:IclR family transcriptional regulator [Catenulispora pinisilvae]|uniref:IclR family transcriptional regulator n=1 Tax=Catenulispora pinisilvae TaxID=2705253 RepID=UPI0018912891|nr:IclR family transcriptional regulator [Catenulispora pinisilvae]
MSGTVNAAAEGTAGYRGRNSTADRALDILLLFDDDRLVLSAQQVAEHLGVARSTAYRYLQSLTTMSFLEENDGGSGFRIGPRVLELARLARKGIGLSDLALPVMRDLVDTTGQAALLTRRTGASVVCLERVEAPTAIRLSYERGQILPVNAGAAALALLAWAPAAERDEILSRPLARFTEATLTDPEALRSRLAEIRASGVALGRGELDPDVLGIAAPVRGSDGGVIAAVSIAALAHRVPDDRVPALSDAVRKAADDLTHQARLSGL